MCITHAPIIGSGELEVGMKQLDIGLRRAGSKVIIGANVDIGPRVYIGTGSHKMDTIGTLCR